jgi:HPt (histidine-containing phosphotransfer) domain-containing protein
MMPVMDGPATLARLRDNARTARIPVVFMTARAQTRELELFRSLGAAGVIPKPFDPMTLAAAVRGYAQPMNGRLDALRNVFLQRLHEDATALAGHRSALQDGTAGAATRAAIRDVAHGLAGTGGIFGFSEISDAAAAVEDAVIAERDGSGAVEGIAAALDHLLACAATNGSCQKEPSHPLA